MIPPMEFTCANTQSETAFKIIGESNCGLVGVDQFNLGRGELEVVLLRNFEPIVAVEKDVLALHFSNR